MTPRANTFLSLSLLALAALPAAAKAAETESLAINFGAKLMSDVRSRGTSDSLNEPGARLNVQIAHESGLIGFAELTTVSKKQFLEGDGTSIVLGAGWRAGDPDGLHYGAGLATEMFPGASYEAPNSFDLNTFTPGDYRRTKYDGTFLVLEAGYGALDMRLMNVISKTYRGVSTGGVCGTLLELNPDPMVGLDCYGRGDKDSGGTWLLDLDYKFPLGAQTTLNLHAGYQRVANFREADLDDYSIGVTHKQWGFEFTGEWVKAQIQAKELYQTGKGADMKTTNDSKIILSVSRMF